MKKESWAKINNTEIRILSSENKIKQNSVWVHQNNQHTILKIKLQAFLSINVSLTLALINNTTRELLNKKIDIEKQEAK